MYEQIAANKRRSAFLIFIFALIVAGVVVAINFLISGGVVGFVIAAVIAITLSFVSYFNSDKVALRMSRAHPADPREYARYHNLVEGLCIAAGLPKPRLYVINDAAPNAFATGRNPKHSALAVTTGLLQLMNRTELEGVIAHELGRNDSPVPDYVSMYSSTEGRRTGTSGFLGGRYAPMFLTEQMVPENIRKLEALSEADHVDRSDLRAFLANRFAQGRKDLAVDSHTSAYQRVRGLMSSEALFDVAQEPQAMRDKYGPTQFGEQCLIARRLVEAGVPFVKVARAWWDSHGQNFETHLELVTELDHVMSTLIDDLQDRGLLEHTTIVVLSEFVPQRAVPDIKRQVRRRLHDAKGKPRHVRVHGARVTG